MTDELNVALVAVWLVLAVAFLVAPIASLNNNILPIFLIALGAALIVSARPIHHR